MRDLDIRGVQRGRKQFTTHADETADRPPDLVKRDFTADAPNELWLADITYCSTWEGWLQVAFVLDVYARVIVGWQIASHMRTDLVIDALDMAAWRRDPAGNCVHHSDAGSPVHVDPLHRTARHRRDLSLGGHRRCSHDCDGRDVERHRLVQPPPAPFRDRRRPPSRARNSLVLSTRSCPRGRKPTNPRCSKPGAARTSTTSGRRGTRTPDICHVKAAL